MNHAVRIVRVAVRAVWWAALAALSSVWVQQAARAQDYPNKPVTIVVPFVPGGNTDVIVRALAAKMNPYLDQKVIVENRPGAGGVIGSAYVAKAKPDGYTVLAHAVSTLTPAFVKELPFDLMRDLAPVGRYFDGSMLLLGSTANPATRTLDELAAYGKRNPGKLTFGAASVIARAGAMVLESDLGFTAPVVLYKGSAEVVNALARGDIDVAVDATNPLARAQIEAGKVRGVVILGPNRNAVLPAVPTVVELGRPQLNQIVTGGMYVPAGTPAVVIARLNSVINKALEDPDLQRIIRQAGHQPTGTTPEELRGIIQNESTFWANAAKKAGIQPE